MTLLYKYVTNVPVLFFVVLLSQCSPNQEAEVPTLPVSDAFPSQGSNRIINSVTIDELSMANFSALIGGVDGGITLNGSGDVWVSANAGIIHISPTGVPDRLNLRGFQPPLYDLRPILWQGDNTLSFVDLPVLDNVLNKSSTSGSALLSTNVALWGSVGNITNDAHHTVWFPLCDAFCDHNGGILIGNGHRYSLGPWVGNSIATGADGYLYMTERNLTTMASVVARISLSGTTTRTYSLPAGSVAINTACCAPSYVSSGIVGGPDHNLWVVENGTNEIARLSIAGRVTQFHIPTANSDPRNIVVGNDGNLWFTENRGNKIGRISTTGQITEYPVPSANSGPDGIASCENVGCANSSMHGHVWFVEDNVNKVGRLDF